MKPVEQYPASDEDRAPPDGDAPLGERLLAELIAAALRERAAGADAAASERIKSRLLGRIATDVAGRTVQPEEGDWLSIWEGVQCKVLHVHSDRELSCLLRFAPGAWLPAHRHPVAEECIVLSGVVRVGEQVHVREGGYHIVQASDLHARVGSDTGALIYLRGAMPEIGLFI